MLIELDQAIAEAGRCLLCHEPPCTKACPAGPSLVVTAIRDGKKAAAGIERHLTGRGMA